MLTNLDKAFNEFAYESKILPYLTMLESKMCMTGCLKNAINFKFDHIVLPP